jgi:hypothetical protein
VFNPTLKSGSKSQLTIITGIYSYLCIHKDTPLPPPTPHHAHCPSSSPLPTLTYSIHLPEILKQANVLFRYIVDCSRQLTSNHSCFNFIWLSRASFARLLIPMCSCFLRPWNSSTVSALGLTFACHQTHSSHGISLEKSCVKDK